MHRPSVIATTTSRSQPKSAASPQKSKRGRKKKLVTAITSTSLQSLSISSRTESKQILSQFILERKEKSIWQKYVRDMSDSIAERLGQQLRQSLKLKALKKSPFSACPTTFEEQREPEMQRHHQNQQPNETNLRLANLALILNSQQNAPSNVHSASCGTGASVSLPLLALPGYSRANCERANPQRMLLDQSAIVAQNYLNQGWHPLNYFSSAAAGVPSLSPPLQFNALYDIAIKAKLYLNGLGCATNLC